MKLLYTISILKIEKYYAGFNMSPKNKFFEVSVRMLHEDAKGKIKKVVYKYLIDGADTSQAEKNALKLLEGTLDDFEIIGINLSKVQEVYIDKS